MGDYAATLNRKRLRRLELGAVFCVVVYVAMWWRVRAFAVCRVWLVVIVCICGRVCCMLCCVVVRCVVVDRALWRCVWCVAVRSWLCAFSYGILCYVCLVVRICGCVCWWYGCACVRCSRVVLCGCVLVMLMVLCGVMLWSDG